MFALASALTYGVSDYVGGRISRHAAPVAVALVAEVSAFAILLVLVPALETEAPTAETVWWGGAAGLFGSVGVLGLYLALARGNMTVVAPVTGVVAAIVPVAVGLALGERPSAPATAGIAVAVVAVALIGGALGAHGTVQLPMVALAVFVGCAFGLLFVAYSRTGDDGTWPLLTARWGATPLLVVAFAVARRQRRAATPDRTVAAAGVAIGVLIGLANGFYLLASRRGLLSVVAVVVALYPASTVALATIVDRERATAPQIAGMALAVVAVVAITVGS